MSLYRCTVGPFAYTLNKRVCWLVVCARVYFAIAHMFSSHLRHFSNYHRLVLLLAAFAPFSQSALNASVLLLDHVLFRFIFYCCCFFLFFYKIYYDWIYARERSRLRMRRLFFFFFCFFWFIFVLFSFSF